MCTNNFCAVIASWLNSYERWICVRILQAEVDICTNNFCAVIAPWLNSYEKSRNDVGMNRYAKG